MEPICVGQLLLRMEPALDVSVHWRELTVFLPAAIIWEQFFNWEWNLVSGTFWDFGTRN